MGRGDGRFLIGITIKSCHIGWLSGLLSGMDFADALGQIGLLFRKIERRSDENDVNARGEVTPSLDW